MLIKGHRIKVPMILNLILVLVFVTASAIDVESRKLDETKVPPATNSNDEKCVPCGYPSPPPPANPPPSPPPPSPKKPSPSQYCPPPPAPSSYIYITGPPGNLYPVDQDFSGASRRHHRSFAVLLFGLLGILAF